MKKYISTIIVVCLCKLSPAQEKFIGIWEGELDAGIQKLKMVFTFSKTTEGITKVTIQAPQQSPLHIPADTVYFPAVTEVVLEKKQFNMRFTGKLVNDSSISGSFVQGASIPLELKKVEKASAVGVLKRPQVPRPPFSYASLPVHFTNKKDAVTLAGTLTLPDTIPGKKYPAVVLISGSGPQDRDETFAGHKPFAVIADHLTKNGFAVLRYDDRGVAASTGNHAAATSKDFAEDTRAAVDFLKSNKWTDAGKIGLIGHSEGGIIAPMVAANNKDIKFIVLLAGPGIPCIDLMTEQNIAFYQSIGVDTPAAKAYGPLFKEIANTIIHSKDSMEAIGNAIKVLENWKADEHIKKVFNAATDSQREAFSKGMVSQMYTPWFRYFLAYDPAPVLKRLSCAVLALNGSRDLQVLPVSNLAGIQTALKKSRSKDYKVEEIPQLNHMFQTCKRCTLNEYGNLEETFSPEALKIITGWLKKQAD